jgi:uncharacterized membrane protein YgcG
VTRLPRLLALSFAVLAVLAAPATASAAIAAPASEVAAARAAVGPRAGDVSDFSFRSFDATYALGRSADQHATLDVTETIVAVFPKTDQNRGIVRDIPASNGSADLNTKIVSVTDENGKAVPYDETSPSGFVELALGTDAYVHGATTYVIHYTQTDTIRHFTNTDDDEFYWDVNGTGWEQPFAEVSAAVTVSPDLVDALNGHNACYQGAANSTTTCSGGVTSPDETAGTFVASATDLGPEENLTVAIGFASGTFVDVSSADAPGSDDVSFTPLQQTGILLSLLGIPGALVGIIGGLVARRKRVQPARGFIVPQYSAPDGIDVMAAAQLIAKPQTAVPAQLVNLAVQGKTRLLGYATTNAQAADYSVQLLDPTGLTGFEPGVVQALFGPDATAGAAHDLQRYGDDVVAQNLEPIVASLPGWLETSGYYEGRRRSVGAIVVLAVTIALLVTAIVGVVLSGFFGVILGAFVFIGGILGLAFAGSAVYGTKKLSDKGAQMNDYLLGMKMYLQLAEADRLKVLQSPTGAERIDIGDGKQLVKLYEKLLPWAIIWGIEDQWSQVLEIELQKQNAQPDFWVGQNAFTTAAFLPLIGGLGRSTSAIPVSTGGLSNSGFSSFGGGSFGGGFSGGGGGGGGGGGR